MQNMFSKFTIIIFSFLLFISFSTAYALDDSSNNKLSAANITKVINAAHAKYKNNKDGKNADYIKALADVDSDLFGITIVTVDGKVYEVGDARSEFSIQSVSKVFTAAKAMQQHGAEAVQEKVGA
jgi:glutaminase